MPKTLAERWHECPVCGLSAPRNVVSAQVILERARIGRSRHNVRGCHLMRAARSRRLLGDGVITVTILVCRTIGISFFNLIEHNSK